MRKGRRPTVPLLALFLVLLATPDALAQTSLAGAWAALFHEDQPERGPGPELGEFGGLPVNDAARHYADAWNSARLTVPQRPADEFAGTRRPAHAHHVPRGSGARDRRVM
jgi:hypothetical protein